MSCLGQWEIWWQGCLIPILAFSLFQVWRKQENRDAGVHVLASLAHLLLAVVVSFQIHFLVDFTMRKALKPLRYFSPEGFLEPTYCCSGPLSHISPIKVNGRHQDQALSGCLVSLAPCLDLKAIKCSCHIDVANKHRCFHFNEKSYKELVTIPWLYGMVKLTRICLFRACKKCLVRE